MFGEILAEIGRGEGELAPMAERIVTTSPDVTVSTNLGPWVNRRGIFDRHTRNDVFRDNKLASAQRWGMSPAGQHIELGIAEQNLFLMLGAAGLSHSLHGARLLPVGTVYDPFVNRGLDALIYACYQDSRFLLVSTPSGITLAPEGGQHQSINTPLIGMAADRLHAYEPAHGDELAILLRHAFVHMQQPDGCAVWLRLSTRQLDQPTRSSTRPRDRRRALGGAARAGGAHRAGLPGPGGARGDGGVRRAAAEEPGGRAAGRHQPGPPACRLAGRGAPPPRRAADATSHVERILAPLAPGAALVTVLDGHPAAHSWLGAVRGQRVVPLGPDRFGQGGDLPDLYREYGLDEDAILDACAQALLA